MANEKRLIDANELVEALYKSDAEVYSCYWMTSEIVDQIDRMPTVDAEEVVHGRWEKAEYDGFLRCSECKDVYIDDTWVADGKWNYCPNCGAKMDGDGNG